MFQSGGFGYAIVNLAELQGVGFRYCVSSGNETDTTTPELLEAFLDDPGTELAFAVIEGTPDARRLLDVGRKALETGKPVLIWKSANTEAGAKAAASHTANMTGRADLFRAAFRQSGLIEVDDVEPMVDIAKLVAQGRLPKGNRIGALSISGGSGIVFADRCVREGLVLPRFTPRTVAALKKIIPTFGSSENPADVTAGIFNDMGLLTKTLDIVLDDPNIDQLTIMLASIPGKPAAGGAEAIAAAAQKTDKPVHLAWSGRRSKSEEAFRILEAANVPVISTPVRLATAAAALARFAMDRQRLLPRKAPTAAIADSQQRCPKAPSTLSEAESKAVLTRRRAARRASRAAPRAGPRSRRGRRRRCRRSRPIAGPAGQAGGPFDVRRGAPRSPSSTRCASTSASRPTSPETSGSRRSRTAPAKSESSRASGSAGSTGTSTETISGRPASPRRGARRATVRACMSIEQ